LPSPSFAETFLPEFRDFVFKNPNYGHITDYSTSSPLYKFLSLIRAPSSSEEYLTDTYHATNVFTPSFLPIDPERFFLASEYFLHGYSYEPPVIFLYQDVEPDKFINGIFFNLETNLAKWHYSLDSLYPDGLPSEDWVPLQSILSEWLHLWDIGKYAYREEGNGGLRLYERPWTERDVEECLEKWEALLAAIDTLRPVTDISLRRIPLDSTLLEPENYNSFAATFLSRAQLPNFKLVAPGITYFTDDSFKSLYGSEPPDSIRRKPYPEWGGHQSFPYNEDDNDDRISLIFPSVNPIPPVKAIKREERGWDFEYTYLTPDVPGSGMARYTVERMGGLYSSHNDEVKFYDVGGGMNAFGFDRPCPWGQGRGPKLSEVLTRWRELIEKGVWLVGPDGVMDSEDWWVKNAGSKYLKLNWK